MNEQTGFWCCSKVLILQALYLGLLGAVVLLAGCVGARTVKRWCMGATTADCWRKQPGMADAGALMQSIKKMHPVIEERLSKFIEAHRKYSELLAVVEEHEVPIVPSRVAPSFHLEEYLHDQERLAEEIRTETDRIRRDTEFLYNTIRSDDWSDR